MKRFFFIFFISMTLIACDKAQSCFNSGGKEKTKKVILENFNKLNINDVFNIQLVDTSEYSISITTREKNIKNINYKIENGELTVSYLQHCSWLVKREFPTILISSPNLKQIHAKNSCKIVSVNTLKYKSLNIQAFKEIFDADLKLNCDTLFFRANGTGVYKFSGKAKYANITNLESGYFMGEDFEVKKMKSVHKSLGESVLNVTHEIWIEVIDYGKVYLRSNYCPTVNVHENCKQWLVNQTNCK